MTLFLDRKEYSGDLFSQLEQTEAFIKNHINLRGEIKGLQRTDTFEIPEAALREALINAFIHRDYTNQGRDIKVGVYDDIVNVVSPGGLPNSLTAEALTEGRSEIRNRVVARVFKELGFIEQWGSGIQRIKNICTSQGLVEPRIREKGDFVDVEFYRPVADSAGLVSDTEDIVPDSRTITAEIGRIPADNGGQLQAVAPDYARLADDTTSDAIGRMPDTGVKVPDNIGLVPDTLTSQEFEVISHINQYGSITSVKLEAILSVKERRARVLLQKMTDKGLLEKRGSARSTHYVSAIEMLQRVKI